MRTHQIVSLDRILGLTLLFAQHVLYFGCYCRSARQGSACRLYQRVQDGLRKSW